MRFTCSILIASISCIHPSSLPAPLPEAQTRPDGLLTLAAAQAGARLREQPLRGGGGTEATRPDPLPNRNPGKSVAAATTADRDLI